MKCYWLCLQNTYSIRKFNPPSDIKTIFVSEKDNLNSNFPVVIECKEINKEVFEKAVKYSNSCIFSENLKLDSVNFSLLNQFAIYGVSLFWNMNDLKLFLKNLNEINNVKNTSDLIKFILKTENFPHSGNVAELSYNIALRLFNVEAAQLIRYAGFLHDIGKLCLPYSFLNAPKWFSPLEKKIAQLHTIYGEVLLKKLNIKTSINCITENVISDHHERNDGSGYPDKKKEFDISLPAKIVAVADVYDALRSNRPYRSGCDHELAINYLKAKTKEFDPKIVKILEEVVNESENLWDEE